MADAVTQAKWDKLAPRFDTMASAGAEKRWAPAKSALFSEMEGKVLFLALGTGLLFLWLAWEFRPRRGDPAVRTYRRFIARLERSGIEHATGEAPRNFALRVRSLRPDLGVTALAITETYLRLRYLPEPSAADLRQLRSLVGRFRP